MHLRELVAFQKVRNTSAERHMFPRLRYWLAATSILTSQFAENLLAIACGAQVPSNIDVHGIFQANVCGLQTGL
jgi:hypothetical protein